ncbi:hypothetical protein PCANC_01078 [Puccinia coronata f. sp. avenae]|uniref:OPT family small oligopeptide transporter n=1 Tax=Puccinia coronata f. sp. avenae TaxID=200324 RepID=A0A2N5V5R6_9BASI|nr:hypothetical protein PCANC_03162 [Puccinia coronata f. sp. avenae]PLW45341.1 hypothetical protein PCASD_03081 [Puccinia coronata f. sp. avenae]PLW57618.1 hypothetical protein PCANC_01078 [Puccinia coronata f. sp. avenae]
MATSHDSTLCAHEYPEESHTSRGSTSHRLTYPSHETYAKRHTTGKISCTSLPSEQTTSRHKSFHACPSTTCDVHNELEKRHSIRTHKNNDTSHECVILEPQGKITEEATMFPLEDDPTEQAITYRSCLTGIIMAIIGSAVGLLFIFKPVVVYLAPVFLQIMCMFFGRILALIPGPKWWNPGAFSLKETVYSSLIASAARNVAYSILMLATEDLYFEQKSSAMRSLGILFSTQMLGLGWGCLIAPILVHPAITLFPQVLSSAALFYSVSSEGEYPKRQIALFRKVFIGISLYEIIPTYLMPALQGVSFPCLFFPAKTSITSLFGGVAPFEGLGFFELSFDWNMVGAGSPLATPLFAQGLQVLSAVITALVFWPAYKFSWFGYGQKEEFPFLSVSLFQENGTLFPVKQIAKTANETDQSILSYPIYTSTNILTQIFQSLAVSSSITHIFLWQWPLIRRAFTRTSSADDKDQDPHRLLVQASYIDLPVWMAAACLATATIWALALCYMDNKIAPYSILISIGFSGILSLSMGFIYGISGYNMPINSVCQMIGGLLFRNNVMGNLWFSNYSSATTSQALSYMAEMKLGQYTHMPPVAVAAGQATGMVVGVIVNYVILEGLMRNQREALLMPNGNGIYSGTLVQSYGASAVAWGRFSDELYTWGARYVSVPLALGYGLGLPLPFYILYKFWPHIYIKDLNIPIVMGFVALGTFGVTAGRTNNILVGLASQMVVRRYRPNWFLKYNYVLSAVRISFL